MIELLENFTPIFQILISILIVYIPILRNQKHNLQLQNENTKNNFRIQIFKEIANNISNAQDKLTPLVTSSYSLIPLIREYKNITTMNESPPKHILEIREKIYKLHHEAMKEIGKLTGLIENYEIAIKEISIFKPFFIKQQLKCTEIFHPMYLQLMDYLPMKLNDQNLKSNGIKYIYPSFEKLQNLEIIEGTINDFNSNLVTTLSFLLDLGVEAQNQLLGKIFEKAIPIREPLEPGHLVISTDSEKMKILQDIVNQDKFEEEKKYWEVKKNTQNNEVK
jgi:hypothetical protein